MHCSNLVQWKYETTIISLPSYCKYSYKYIYFKCIYQCQHVLISLWFQILQSHSNFKTYFSKFGWKIPRIYIKIFFSKTCSSNLCFFRNMILETWKYLRLRDFGRLNPIRKGISGSKKVCLNGTFGLTNIAFFTHDFFWNLS